MAKNPKKHELRNRNTRLKLNLERVDRPRAMLPERHLFVTEGTKTEPTYLNGIVCKIVERFGNSAKQQFQIMGEGDNTLNLLMQAESYQQNDADGFEHIWIIYDKDDFPPDHFDNTVHRCQALNARFKKEGRNTQYHAIWSNECIELWFLLHFVYLDTQVNRGQYQKMLTEYLQRHYEKNDERLFDELFPYINNAVKRAKRLRKNYKENTPPSQQSPCTMFFENVEELDKYL